VLVAAVCARAGSKGLPGKNLRPLCGVPLIDRAIGSALQTMADVVVSTDIDAVHMPVATYGGRFHYLSRPPELANGTVSKWPVYQHILEWAQSEWPAKPIEAVVDIDVSRPLVTAEDVNKCIVAWYDNSYADTVLAVSPARKNPYFDILEPDLDGMLTPAKSAGRAITCRQDVPPTYYHAGVYVVGADALRTDSSMWDGKVYGCEVSELAAFDIDDQLDWDICEMLLRQRVTA